MKKATASYNAPFSYQPASASSAEGVTVSIFIKKPRLIYFVKKDYVLLQIVERQEILKNY
jgi:hypothetical protein